MSLTCLDINSIAQIAGGSCYCSCFATPIFGANYWTSGRWVDSARDCAIGHCGGYPGGWVCRNSDGSYATWDPNGCIVS